MFFKKTQRKYKKSKGDFSHIPKKIIYLDSACQTPRPRAVIAAVNSYYMTYNACGERVKYPWGEKVDHGVEDTRRAVLKHLGKSHKEYVVCFTHNTTTGINLVLAQLSKEKYKHIVTSDIEHNSVFLPTITIAKSNGWKRHVLSRTEDGSLPLGNLPKEPAVCIVNNSSNIDGRLLPNAGDIAKTIHKNNGLLLIDAAQSFGHHPHSLRDLDFDVCFASSHKSYGPSMGIIVIKKELLEQLEISTIGGGMVGEVKEQGFTLLAGDHLHSRLEMGLQSWEGIIGLGAALEWMKEFTINGASIHTHEEALSTLLHSNLSKIPKLHLVGTTPGSSISFYHEDIDSHQLALMLAEGGVYARSGYFCCHYYLKEKRKLPPLVRFAVGAHLTSEDIAMAEQRLNHIITALT